MAADDELTPIPSGPYRCPACGDERLDIRSQALDGLTPDTEVARAYFRFSCPCGFRADREATIATRDVITSAAVAVLRCEAGQPL